MSDVIRLLMRDNSFTVPGAKEQKIFLKFVADPAAGCVEAATAAKIGGPVKNNHHAPRRISKIIIAE